MAYDVVCVYLAQVSLLLICQQILGHFSRCRPLLPCGLRIVQILRQCRRKTTNAAPTILLLQYKQQANSILSKHNYTTLVISRNDKNKQLTLLSQHKLAVTARNTLFAIYSKTLELLKNLKNVPVLYLGLKLTTHVIQSRIHLVRQSL